MGTVGADYQSVTLNGAARRALRRTVGLGQTLVDTRVTLSDALVACTAVAAAHLDDYRRELEALAGK